VAIWIRQAIENLVAYQQLDQSFTRVVSLRAVTGNESWEKLQKSKEKFSTNFVLPPDIFFMHENVRLRGLGASLIGEAGTVPWSIVIKLPEEAYYLRSGENASVSQGDVPSCFIGRVENRKSTRPIEMGGMISLMNASPIGEPSPKGYWTISIIRPANTAEKFSDIEDILLEVSAVGVPCSI